MLSQCRIMSDFRDFFTTNAKYYSDSSSHAKGSDLAILTDLLSGNHYSKCLDIATGTGFTAIAMSPFCNEVIALDATQAMLDEAKKNANESSHKDRIFFRLGTAENTELEPGSLDLVTCRRAAHHFVDKTLFLKEVNRVLKNGGIFALVDMVTPEDDQQGFLDHLETIRDNSHVHAAKESEWKSLIESAGFTVTNSILQKDERDLQDWLSPIDINSDQGKECMEFVSKNEEELQKSMVWNSQDRKFIKLRCVMVATKK